jgi:signal transduction histidine kinase/ActR/RegA family two-component response regulator
MVSDLPQELLILTDDGGKVLFTADRTGPALPAGTDLSKVPAVKEALDGTEPTLESSFAIINFHGMPFQLGCVPAIQNGQLIGVLLLGDRLDAPALDRIKATVGSDVVVRTGTTVLATSLAGIDGSVLEEGAHRGSMNLAGEDYVVASLAIGRDESGAAVMLDLLRSVSATASTLQRVLTRSFLFYGALAVAIATIAAALLARAQLQSFRDFVGFMGAVAQSRDYSRRFYDHRSTPEMRTLTDAYGHLISSLRESHSQVEARGAQLARANTELRQEVEERERAQQTLRERDEQLRQSQKLEAIGTLAGGVAHDFNNLLTVIHSYCELLMVNVGKQNPMHADLEQIRQAAARAGRLTSQLLAFGRKQVMQPRVVELPSVVSGVEKMLRRLIGEHIELKTDHEQGLSRVKADPGQLEQVILNLAVNARDAMPQGGELVISTRNLVIGEPDPAEHGDTPAGRWVMLAVSDTGTGMDAVTMRRIFEPFFTTKEVGKGTGLGLATVYGIVKQHQGWIEVESEVGRGTAFKVFIPRSGESAGAAHDQASEKAARGGTETILVVEDEGPVRELVCSVLAGHGYRVLQAESGAKALQVWLESKERIDLLLTDLVMPDHLNGRELAERLHNERPRLKVVFTSGYSAEAIGKDCVLCRGLNYLQKPYHPQKLALVVRNCLDAVN